MDLIPSAATIDRLRSQVERDLPAFLTDLQALVELESGSYTKAGVDRVVTWMAERLQALGATIERHAHEEFGDTVVATFAGHGEGPAVLLLGHADTVFDEGFLARRPFEIHDGRALGPGVGDMKSGLLVGLYALEALRATAPEEDEWLPLGQLTFIVTPDEEIGSPVGTPTIIELARGAAAALVLEGARPNGDIVSARKGVLHLLATLRGRAAHAGVDPEKGRSAVLEAAHKTLALHALNGRWPGVSVVVGALNGGTRPNIVPDEALMRIDLRARTDAELVAARAAVMEILEHGTVPDVGTTVAIGADWPPMEKAETSEWLLERARAIALRLGVELGDAATGGGSDANTTAAAGVPTIDGLGPVGGAAHTDEEYIELDSIVPRTTLLAALLRSLATEGI